jgi:hypothetical protein
MPSEIVQAIGEMNSDLELLIERNVDRYKSELQAILDGTAERDKDIFFTAGANSDLVIQDFKDVPIAERGDDWSIGLSALIAASHMQAMSDAGIFLAVVKLAEKSGEYLNETARKAGAVGITEAVGELPGSGITEQKLAEKRVKNA